MLPTLNRSPLPGRTCEERSGFAAEKLDEQLVWDLSR
jgi:hypothetical protein